NIFAPLWTTANPAGTPASTGTLMRALEQIGFFTGLGIVIVLLAAWAAGRFTAVPGVTGAAERATVPAGRPAPDETEIVR
ncbi:MAG TPA: hypothetical protein VHF26_23670, partial [Trebonia sp.]|nr:hypothetical protein [Trebonia sp.]